MPSGGWERPGVSWRLSVPDPPRASSARYLAAVAMPSKWLPLPDERGRWEVEVTRALGEGGFGAVYRGKDRRDSPARECAAKKVGLKSEGEKRTFELEAEVLTKVMGHHAIIELLGEERLSEHGWLFLELATGGELFDRLIDSGSLTEGARTPRAEPVGGERGVSGLAPHSPPPPPNAPHPHFQPPPSAYRPCRPLQWLRAGTRRGWRRRCNTATRRE